MQPAAGIRRKGLRRPAKRSAEPSYYAPARLTRRQREHAAVDEATELAARQAHIDEAWQLPLLLLGCDNVTIISL